jgi:hypothetical protein
MERLKPIEPGCLAIITLGHRLSGDTSVFPFLGLQVTVGEPNSVSGYCFCGCRYWEITDSLGRLPYSNSKDGPTIAAECCLLRIDGGVEEEEQESTVLKNPDYA